MVYDDYIDRFVYDVRLGKSADWFAIKLSSTLYVIEDYYNDEQEILKAFRSLLSDQRVLKVFWSFYHLKPAILDLIKRDPRFRNLRKFLPLVEEAFEKAIALYGEPEASTEPSIIHRGEEYLEYGYETVGKGAPVSIHQTSGEAWGVRPSKYYQVGREEETTYARGSYYPKSSEPRYGNSLYRPRRWPSLRKIVVIVSLILVVFALLYPSTLHNRLPGGIPFIQGRNETKIDIGGIHVSINDRYLVFSDDDGGLPYLYISDDHGYDLHLVPYPVDSAESSVMASYVRVSRSHSKALFPLVKIMEKLRDHGGSKYYLDLPMASRRCELILSNDSIRFGLCEYVDYTIISISTRRSFYDVILESYNTSTMRFLRNLVYHNTVPNSRYDAMWTALEWVDENVEYQYISIWQDIRDPVTFARDKMGICSDYAVFLAATLISAGVQPVYILSMDTQEGGHAAAAVEDDGTLYVLDQHLPVVEWDDYLQYMVKVREPVYVYSITYDQDNGPIIEFHELDKTYKDTYPADTVPSRLAVDASNQLNQMYGGTGSGCVYTRYNATLTLRWEALRLYTPKFHEQWVGYTANEITKHINQKPCHIRIKTLPPDTLIINYDY